MHQAIVVLVQSGILAQPFNVANVQAHGVLIHSPSFLSKHAVGNPGNCIEYFVRVGIGLYELNPDLVH